jgi:hypothetical protein
MQSLFLPFRLLGFHRRTAMDFRIVEHNNGFMRNLIDQMVKKSDDIFARDRASHRLPHQSHALLQATEHIDAFVVRSRCAGPGRASHAPAILQGRIRAEPRLIEKAQVQLTGLRLLRQFFELLPEALDLLRIALFFRLVR